MQAKPDKHSPSHLKLGAGAHYTRLDHLANIMGISEKNIRTLIGALGPGENAIPIVHLPGTGDVRYVLTYAFESAMFALGMPEGIKGNPGLLRVHQELSGVLYGSLTKEALRERVKSLVKSLTSADNKATIGKKKKRTRRDHQTWTGREPSA